MTDGFLDDAYEPSEEEKREIEEVLSQRSSDEKAAIRSVKIKNRIYFHFNTEDHWKGWLRINGIAW